MINYTFILKKYEKKLIFKKVPTYKNMLQTLYSVFYRIYNWRKITLQKILVYIKDKNNSLHDRKEYFYKNITSEMFEELKKPARKYDLYAIAALISEVEPIKVIKHEPLSPVPYTLGNGVVVKETVPKKKKQVMMDAFSKEKSVVHALHDSVKKMDTSNNNTNEAITTLHDVITNDTIDTTINTINDTIDSKNDTIDTTNDTIDTTNDTIDKIETNENNTINTVQDTIVTENDEINTENDEINTENEAIDTVHDTIDSSSTIESAIHSVLSPTNSMSSSSESIPDNSIYDIKASTMQQIHQMFDHKDHSFELIDTDTSDEVLEHNTDNMLLQQSKMIQSKQIPKPYYSCRTQ